MNETEKVLIERGKRYGDFKDHAHLSQLLKKVMRDHNPKKYDELPPFIKEGLEMIQHKIARALNGDPLYDDNYIDIAGYAELIKTRLPTEFTDTP